MRQTHSNGHTDVKKRSLLILVSVSVTFVLLLTAEFMLRLSYPDDARQPNSIAFAFHSDYLVTLKSNMEKTFPRRPINGGNNIVWRTNSAGFRGPELRNDAESRVIVYGDSNIQARFSSFTNTFAEQLRQHLHSSTAKDVEVINAGVVGFGPDQSLLRFRTEVDVYHPDLVVVHIFADNDFGDPIRNRLFELTDAGQLVETTLPRTPDRVLLPDNLSSFRLVKAFRRIGQMFFTTENDADDSYYCESVINDEFATYHDSRPKAFSHFADHYDSDVALFPESDSARTKMQLLDQLLLQFQRLADSKNTDLLVVIQPSARDITSNHRPNHHDFLSYDTYDPANMTQAVDRILNTHNIHGVNLWSTFERNDPDSLYFKGGDNHWNDAGQRLAARQVAEYIVTHSLL